jgi:hypothetical protein
MGPQFDFWYARTTLEFAELDDNGSWYGIVQRNARSALHRARDRAEGQHPAALGQRSALRLDGGARSLAPARGYGVVPAASNAISAIVIPRMSPTA